MIDSNRGRSQEGLSSIDLLGVKKIRKVSSVDHFSLSLAALLMPAWVLHRQKIEIIEDVTLGSIQAILEVKKIKIMVKFSKLVQHSRAV